MSTTLNIVIRDRILDIDGGLQVNWHPELAELRNFVFHGYYFSPGWTEQDIIDYGQNHAIQGICAAINNFFPDAYSRGSVV